MCPHDMLQKIYVSLPVIMKIVNQSVHLWLECRSVTSNASRGLFDRLFQEKIARFVGTFDGTSGCKTTPMRPRALEWTLIFMMIDEK